VELGVRIGAPCSGGGADSLSGGVPRGDRAVEVGESRRGGSGKNNVPIASSSETVASDALRLLWIIGLPNIGIGET
jgi:hypothetical protein